MKNPGRPRTEGRGETHAGRQFLQRVTPLLRRSSNGGRGRWSRASVGLSLLVVVIGSLAAWTLLRYHNRLEDLPWPIDPRIQEALSLLDAGEFESARRLATELRVADLTFEELGGPVYVLGATLIHDADEHWNPAEQRKAYLIGSRYMEEARDRKFPQGREAEGLFLLGKSLYLGGRIAESIPVLQAALAVNQQRRTLLHHYLSQAYLRDEPSRPELALVHMNEYLADRLLTSADRLAGLLQRAEIALRVDDLAGCREALTEIEQWSAQQQPGDGLPPPTAVGQRRRDKSEQRRIAATLRDAVVVAARLAMREADRLADGQSTEKQDLYTQARSLLASLVPEGRETGESEFLLGVALRRLNDPAAAGAQFSRTARRYYGTQEGFAASLELAEIERQLGDQEASLENLLSVLKEVGEPTNYVNRWVGLEALRQRVLAMYAERLDARQYDQAIEIAKHMHPLFPADQASQAVATVYAGWGNELTHRADTAPYAEAVQMRKEAEQYFVQAGQAYEKLAELHYAERDYTDQLWQAGENYLRAHDKRGAELIRAYLRNEPRKRRPRALTLLGEALLSADDAQGALHYFEQCIATYVNDPDSYRARIGAALAALELGQLADAEKFLTDNLENEQLSPRSQEWRDSLFLLGEALHRKGIELLTRSRDTRANAPLDENAWRAAERDLDAAAAILQDAITRLTSATLRYPQDPRSVRGRYLIADAYRHRSKLPRWKLPRESIEIRQKELAGRMRSDLEAAYQLYDQLVQDLDKKQDSSLLSPIEQSVQRNCYFIRAHTLYDLDRYRDALEAYSTATNRYPKEPVSLEAYEQIAACYRHLGDPAKARGTLEQAKIVIADMPTDVDYSETTRYSRQEWLNLLQ